MIWGMNSTGTLTLTAGDHARSQAALRNIPISDVTDAALERLADRRIDPRTADAAILVGYADGGWVGGSNGNVVWAIIRNGELRTVMYRRDDQPSTCDALRVRTVIA